MSGRQRDPLAPTHAVAKHVAGTQPRLRRRRSDAHRSPVPQPWTTGFTSVPTPGMRHSATSPGRTWMAPGVPGEMMSPG